MNHHTENGFTLIEVVVTMLVTVMLIIGMVQIQSSVSQLSIQQNQQRIASELAYNNLRKYVNDNPPSWFQCEINGGNAQPQTLIDDSGGSVDGLPSPVSQKVVATAPYLCGGGTTGIGMPIRVESTVTYGPDGRKVTHASYAAF